MNLSIKNVPEEMVEQLRSRARAKHRSLQGELMAMIEESLAPERSSVSDVGRQVAAMGYHTADEAVRMVREDRDNR